MNATIRIAPRSTYGFNISIMAGGVNVARTWRATPASAYTDAQRLAGIKGAYVIPHHVDVSPLYRGASIVFSEALS
jgi:hypothetical protein